jgi:hypothetical protein
MARRGSGRSDRGRSFKEIVACMSHSPSDGEASETNPWVDTGVRRGGHASSSSSGTKSTLIGNAAISKTGAGATLSPLDTDTDTDTSWLLGSKPDMSFLLASPAKTSKEKRYGVSLGMALVATALVAVSLSLAAMGFTYKA